MLGKIEGKRIKGQQRVRWLDSITYSMDMNSSKLQEMVKDSKASRAVVHRVSKSQKTQLSYRTTTTTKVIKTSNSNSCFKMTRKKKQEAFKYNGVNTFKGGVSF